MNSTLLLSILGALFVTGIVLAFVIFLILVANKKAKEERELEAFSNPVEEKEGN